MKLLGAIDLLEEEKRVKGCSERTIRDYREKATRLVKFLGDKEVDQVTKADLRRFLDHLRTQPTRYKNHPYREELPGPLSKASVDCYRRVIRLLFSFLETEGLVPGNPAKSLTAYRPVRGRPKAISPEDVAALLGAIEGDTAIARRDRALLYFLYDTGCRVRAAVALKVQEVDLERRIAYLREKGDKWHFGFFSEVTGTALTSWLEMRPVDRGDRVFLGMGSNGNGALSAQGIREVLRRLKHRAGVKGPVNPHSFRHAFAREYLKNGGDLATLADIMGHSDVKVTWQAYAVFTVEELKAAHSRHSPVAQLFTEGVP